MKRVKKAAIRKFHVKKKLNENIIKQFKKLEAILCIPVRSLLVKTCLLNFTTKTALILKQMFYLNLHIPGSKFRNGDVRLTVFV